MKRTLIFLPLCLLLCWQLSAQQSLILNTQKESYNPGDTIQFRCIVPEWEGTQKLGTINLLIEDIQHQNTWRFRYPMVDGFFEADWVLPANLPAGQYMVTADLQPVFFQLTGQLLNKLKEDSIRYTLQLEDQTIIAGTLALNKEGYFRMPRHVFSGRGTLFFSPYEVEKGKNQADVSIKTPLDSPYSPIAHSTVSIFVGKVSNEDVGFYSADTNLIRNQQQGTLDNVTVNAQAKKKLQKFDEENSSGFFKGERARVFGGLDGEFSGFVTILDYLQGRVAGLNISKDTEEFGAYNVSWRNEPSAFFLDEVPVDLFTIYNFPPSEIAMLKIFPPPFMGMIHGSGGGAIAIYSKRATLGNSSRYKNRFVIQGFSPTLSVLMPNQTN